MSFKKKFKMLRLYYDFQVPMYHRGKKIVESARKAFYRNRRSISHEARIFNPVIVCKNLQVT